MRFERRPEKTYHKKPPWGKNVQEIWVGTMAQAPSDLKPILRRLYKNEIRTADTTGLGAWYLKKKELNKEKKKKINQDETKRTRLVLKPRWQPRVIPVLIYPTFLPMMSRPGTRALVVSRADKIVISALFASSLVRNNILHYLLRLRSFGVIRIRISDPRSVWIMVHQRNRWLCSGHGFTGSLMHHAPDSHWITDPDPDHPKGTQPYSTTYERRRIFGSHPEIRLRSQAT